MRQVIVEPVIGYIKDLRGFRRFALRSLSHVQAEWRIICTTHNLLKLFRYRGRHVPVLKADRAHASGTVLKHVLCYRHFCARVRVNAFQAKKCFDRLHPEISARLFLRQAPVVSS
jgi:hypothetical protein